MDNKRKYEMPKVLASEDELAKALYLANKKMSDMEEKRSYMFANISHDLRAPLAAINGRLEYLVGEFKKDKDSVDIDYIFESLQMMLQRGKSMEKLIEDIFLMARLDNDIVSADLEKVPVAFFLEDYYYMIIEEPKYKDRIIISEIPEGTTEEINIDTEKMTRVLDNLFTNALKYSNTGDKITLGLKIEENKAIIYVRDNGIGIDEEDLPRIFERCYKVQEARTPGVEASYGLGLSIAKSFVELCNGTIRCESKKSSGTTFYMEFPIVT